jgi:hypothetical protein
MLADTGLDLDGRNLSRIEPALGKRRFIRIGGHRAVLAEERAKLSSRVVKSLRQSEKLQPASSVIQTTRSLIGVSLEHLQNF